MTTNDTPTMHPMCAGGLPDTAPKAHEARYSSAIGEWLDTDTGMWLTNLCSSDDLTEALERVKADAPWLDAEALPGIAELRLRAERLKAIVTTRLVPFMLTAIWMHTEVERAERRLIDAIPGAADSDELTAMLAKAAGTKDSFDAVSFLVNLAGELEHVYGWHDGLPQMEADLVRLAAVDAWTHREIVEDFRQTWGREVTWLDESDPECVTEVLAVEPVDGEGSSTD